MKQLILKTIFLLAVTMSFAVSQFLAVSALVTVNNFTIEDYSIEYNLDRDADGRSVLKTIEYITALFPQTDQNHGIERAIPESYDGHSVGLSIDSVTDQNNVPYNYSTYSSNGNTVLRIGDADKYVHGLVTYKIAYTQRDVTKYFSDTNRDEFYWDTNGTDWRVPIKNLTVRLNISNSLADATSGDMSCYVGVSGSNEKCLIHYVKNQVDGNYEVAYGLLGAGENITISVGFNSGTFSVYQASFFEIALGIMLFASVLTAPIALILIFWLFFRYYKTSNRSSELGTIVPEYIPPKNTSISAAAVIVQKTNNVFSAQLIDFAVRHYIRIYETQRKTFFRSANYELEITRDISDLKQEEQEIFRDIFSDTQVGSRLDMKSMKNNYALAVKLNDNSGKLEKSIRGAYGLRARDDKQSNWLKRFGIIVLIFAIVTISFPALLVAVISLIFSHTLKPLTNKGLELFRYIKGLEMYIKVAEVERLRVLQSPDGASKRYNHVDSGDSKQMIVLYERLLPYAILFGQEKEWNKRLGDYYNTINQTPSWFSSSNPVFNAAAFGAAISSFSQAATYSNPSNSSSGGSGGGGSSGGGGGGGGGGGW